MPKSELQELLRLAGWDANRQQTPVEVCELAEQKSASDDLNGTLSAAPLHRNE